MQENKYTEDDITYMSPVEYVCSHPLLNTAQGSLEEVYSFIKALKLAAKEEHRIEAEQAINWFCRHSELINSRVNFKKLREEYGSDSAVLEQLLKELKQNRA